MKTRSHRYPQPAPAPKRNGRPPRLRWPDLDPVFHNPSKLTGTDALAYRMATGQGEEAAIGE